MRKERMRAVLPINTLGPLRLAARFGQLGALLISYEGHISRRDFWIGSAIMASLMLIAERVLFKIAPVQAPLAMILIGALAIYPFGALATKRGVDRGHGESWGIMIVLISLALGFAARTLLAGPFAFHASVASICMWLFTLVDLGLLPKAAHEHIHVSTVGENSKR